MQRAIEIIVNGRVQGVGFRPFIFELAHKYSIYGTVQNNMDGVKIHAEGETEQLHLFISDIKYKAPRLSRIDRIASEEAEIQQYRSFNIIPSERDGKSSLVIPVDSAVCEDCLEELMDQKNFRYRYPFINCTQCGPRYTIIEELPYDRPYTVMKEFEMCAQCREEYENPRDRRHHAQPIACSTCGPTIGLYSMNKELMADNDAALKQVQSLLEEGFIVAIKGLGGYHLACDARNEAAVKTLRERKNRPNRPLAIMAKSLDHARHICNVSNTEEKVLQSPESPIVILAKKSKNSISEEIAPGMNTLGVMLPYTPLHHLIFDQSQFDLLVMTSANPSGMPILYQDGQAYNYLSGIADFVLSTNREILHPLDDSVVQIIDNELYFIRRSRGYVPDPLEVKNSVHGIVALGSQMKNTFAIGRHHQIFLGPHVGDLDHLEVTDFFRGELTHLLKWMGTEPETVAVDLHPQYATTNIAREYSENIIQVQHHHAHFASCMEENQLEEETFGVILDGTGFGEDGNIWGFEFLYGNKKAVKRLGHLRYTPLPGGEKAIKEPWRNAVGMLIELFGNEGMDLAKKIFNHKEYEINIIANMVEKKVNSPLAGTCGRLFDAVSAILGLCHEATYDGEPAIRLSEFMLAHDQDFEHSMSEYNYNILLSEDGLYELDARKMLKEIIQDYLENKSTKLIVKRFHSTIVHMITDTLLLIISERNHLNKKVVLSGGSFHNAYLLIETKKRLIEKGFQVYTHNQVPCSDGGLALGQLAVAASFRNQYTIN